MKVKRTEAKGAVARAEAAKREAEQKAARAKAMRELRARKRAQADRNPEPEPPESEEAPPAEAQAEVERAKAALEAEQAKAAAAAEERKRARKLLVDALCGTVEAVADVAQVIAMDSNAPHLGSARSRDIAELWAPILEPHMTPELLAQLPVALACAGTAHALYDWRAEYQAHKPARPKPAAPPVQETRVAAAPAPQTAPREAA